MSHTPGPWGFVYDGSSDYAIGPADDPQGDRICTLYGRHVSIEDVRLIVAVPDLLAACKAVKESCPCDPDTTAKFYAAWTAMLAAIQKSEGHS